jgi:hypothetical protein
VSNVNVGDSLGALQPLVQHRDHQQRKQRQAEWLAGIRS